MKSTKHFITKSGNKPNNYISNKEMYEAIVLYHKDIRAAKRKGEDTPPIPEFIGKCIYQIANNLSMSPSFINYSFRTEMVSDGCLNSIQYFHNFNPKKYKNPFAYFTQIMIFAFIRRIKKEEESRYAKCNYMQHTLIHGADGLNQIDWDNQDETGNHLLNRTMYDNLNEFMSKFEARISKQKEKRRQTKRKTTTKKKVKSKNAKPRKVA